jgi:ribosomal protein S18 acetylase RimI-like enzyme
MHICAAEEKHIPGIIELLKQVGQVHHLGRPDLFRAGAQKYNEADLRNLLQDESRPIFIAEEDGKVRGYGFCILKVTKNDPVLVDNTTLYIDDLCVDETCRGKHIGKAVYAHIVGYAKSIGCDSVTLNVWAFNERAMGFYESLGMKPQKIGMEMRLEEN